MKTKYLLVEWPESQKWLDHEDCYLATGTNIEDLISGPIVFVPETIYNLSNK